MQVTTLAQLIAAIGAITADTPPSTVEALRRAAAPYFSARGASPTELASASLQAKLLWRGWFFEFTHAGGVQFEAFSFDLESRAHREILLRTQAS